MSKSNMKEDIVSHSHKGDEIDLIELVHILWKKKLTILLFSTFFMTIAGIYAFTAKEQWTSNANITAPRISDLGNMLPARAEFARITENHDFSAASLATSLHSELRHFLLSNDLKMRFIEQSDWVKEQLKDKSELEKQQFVSKFINEYLQIHKPDNAKKDKTELDEIGLKISLSLGKPENAQKVLVEFIDFVNQYTIEEANKNFRINVNLLLDNLKFTKQRIEDNLKAAKIVKVENLFEALDIAKKAGIKDFIKNSSASTAPEYLLGDAKINLSDSKLSDGTYTFMLGEKYLQAQLDIAKQAEVIYPMDYYKAVRQINSLEPLMAKFDDIQGTKAYSYLASPDYPVTKDKPKRLFILAIGFLVGTFLSMLYLLITNLFKKD